MSRSSADNWSIARSLAFLAATFAIVFGSLLPFAAQAAAAPGQTLVMCSAQGPQTVQAGANDMDGPARETLVAKCAACVIPLAAVLPEPAPGDLIGPRFYVEAVSHALPATQAPPPARAPPRPPSTAPPLA